MKFENTSVYNFKNAFRGMRNPKNSWDKSDSTFGYISLSLTEQGKEAIIILNSDENIAEYVKIGENDLRLAQALIRGGSEHRKFLRQIIVSVDITAPLYFFKELSTYKIGTVANSTSTMHKLAETPITMSCFEMGDYQYELTIETPNLDRPYPKRKVATIDYYWEHLILVLETLRQEYNLTKEKQYWKELIRLLPESWLQTRTWTCNYENLLTIYRQRRFHKLNEWNGNDDMQQPNFISWIKTLPYAKELILIE